MSAAVGLFLLEAQERVETVVINEPSQKFYCSYMITSL